MAWFSVVELGGDSKSRSENSTSRSTYHRIYGKYLKYHLMKHLILLMVYFKMTPQEVPDQIALYRSFIFMMKTRKV